MKKVAHNYRYKKIRITAEGWIFLIVLSFISVGAVLRNVNLLLLMAGMMFAPLIINWRLGVLWLKTLTAKRNVPRRIHARQLASIQWVCHNRARLSAWNVEIHDNVRPSEDVSDATVSTRLPNESRPKWYDVRRVAKWFFQSSTQTQGLNVRVEIPQIGSGRSESAHYRAYFHQRGGYQFGPAVLVTRFPFGLIGSRIFLPESQTVYVAPAVGKLTPTWERRMRSSVAGSDAVQRRRGLEEEEFYALRPWRSGDSRKQIHWRTTAKFGHPIVKQHEQPDNRDFAMLLDLYEASKVTEANLDRQPGSESRSSELSQKRCETVMSFATTVLLQLGDAVRGKIAMAICGHETVVCQHRNQHEIVDRSMQELAIAKPTPQPELVHAILELASCVAPATPLYIISPRTSAPEFSFLNDLPPKSINDSIETSLNSRTRRQLVALWPMVRWIPVDSDEFRKLFSSNQDTDNANLKSLADKWRTAHVSR